MSLPKRIIFDIFIVLFASILFPSCIAHRDLLNLQTKGADTKAVQIPHTNTEYLLQEGDILTIKVSSPDPQSVAIFNKTTGQANSNQITEMGIYLNSYVVTDSGMVNLPIIGNLKLSGLSVAQAQTLVSEKMEVYYKYSSIDLKLMSFRVTVLGEVTRQGTFVVYNPTANILQAIGEAGGITDMGNRRKVRIVRKTSGQSTVTYVDLYSDQLIASEYYQLQPNDIIYVEPLPAKARRLNLPAIQAILSGLTFVIVAVTFIQRQ